MQQYDLGALKSHCTICSPTEVQPLITESRAVPSAQDSKQLQARESVLRWFVAFTNRFRRTDQSADSEVDGSADPTTPTYVMPATSLATANVPADSALMNKENLHIASEIIRKVLYSTKDNVQLLHEVFRQVGSSLYLLHIKGTTVSSL